VLFATVGTTDFDGLIERLDQLAPQLDEELICQIGNGHYQPRNGTFFRFEPSLGHYIDRARVVVSHGGQGSIMDVVRRGKPLVGVSNPDRRDHHQDDILSKFAEMNHLVWCRSLADLPRSLEQAAQARFAPYVPPTCDIHHVIYDTLTKRVPRR
jgi:beta-1,4-N-acetylglucosaminyltransferase